MSGIEARETASRAAMVAGESRERTPRSPCRLAGDTALTRMRTGWSLVAANDRAARAFR